MFKRTKYHSPKFDPPQVSGLCIRERLFEQLDKLAGKRVLWLSSPAGSGKTSLVASYLVERNKNIIWYQLDSVDGDVASFFHHMALCIKNAYPKKRGMLSDFTSEYLGGLPAFSVNYFRELFKKVEPDSVLVLDNFQDAGRDVCLHEVLQYAVNEIPYDVMLVILSREDPPKQLVYLQTSPQFYLLSIKDVSFDREESDAVAYLRSESSLHEAQYAQLYELTQGWAAGLILTLTHLKVDPNFLSHQVFDDRNALFHYVAQEIVADFDEPTRQVLLKTAFLKRISVSVAKKLTGEARTKQILQHLSSNQLLTIQHDRLDTSFEYHPLFREFLLLLAQQEFTEKYCMSLQNRAAELLFYDGDIQSAVQLFIKINNWTAISELIKKQASELVRKGLYLTLENWLKDIPKQIINTDAWLLYWLGCVKLVFNPQDASNYFYKANELFFIKPDRKGIYLSWIGMVSCVIFGTDDYQTGKKLIKLHEKIQSQFPRYPSLKIRAEYTFCIFTLMMLVDPLHKDFFTKKKEMERQYKIVPFKKEKVLLGTFLLNYYLFYGNSKKLEDTDDQIWKYINSDKLPPLHKMCICVGKTIRSFMQASDVDVNFAYEMAEDIEKKYGVSVFRFLVSTYISMLYLSLSNNEKSKKFIGICCSKKDPSRRLEMAQCEYIKSWYAMNNNLIEESTRYMENSLEYIKGADGYMYEFVYPKAYVIVLLEGGEIEKAQELLTQIEEKYKDARFIYANEYSIVLVRAYYYFVTGDEERFVAKMKGAIAHGEEFNVTYTGFWINRHMAKMFARCLALGIGEKYIAKVITLRHIQAPPEFMGSDRWPYPLKIYTLGRFSVLFNRVNLEIAGKNLSLLKLLLSYRGRSIPEEKIMEALWPDAEGEQAQSNFKTTLHRLRKIFGELDILELKNRHLSLNDKYCWVDSWTLNHLFEQAQSLDCGTGNHSTSELTTKILQLYKGHFLASETAGWVIQQRKSLRLDFIRNIIILAKSFEYEDSKTAIQCYQRLLEIDSLIEEAYQGLIRCYQTQGRQAEALASYDKYVTILASTSGNSPSSATTDLIKS